MICFPADVGDLSLHEEMLDAAQNQWGRLDCLLNNAGISVKNAVTSSTSNQTASTKTLPLTPVRRFPAQAFSKRLLAQPKPEAELPHRSIILSVP